MALILGAHMSIGNGLLRAAQDTVEVLSANAMQIFLRSPRGGAVKPLDPEVAAAFKQYTTTHKVSVLVHSPYILNFSTPYRKSPWAVKTLVDDLRRAEAIGATGVVLHMGKALGSDTEIALQTMAENVTRALEMSHTVHVPIIVENTAGQGSEIGYRFEVMAQLLTQVGKTKRLMCCVDTQHACAAGYDLKTEKGWKATQKEVADTITWDRVAWIHLNDSKKACGSRVDRHENIGKGFIGTDGIMRVVRFAQKNSIPMVLETPLNDDYQGHVQDLALIRKKLK